MSKLERFIRDEEDSDEEDDLPSFLKLNPNQGGRITQSLRMDIAMRDAHEARQRDLGDKNPLDGCIVDQSQFRNVAVGEGYQHHTVVRQATVQSTARDESKRGKKILDKTAEGYERRRVRKRERERLQSAVEPTEEGCGSPGEEKKDRHKKKKQKQKKKHKKHKKKKHQKDKSSETDSDGGQANCDDDDDDDRHSAKIKPGGGGDDFAGAELPRPVDPTATIDALKEMRRQLVAAIARQRTSSSA